MKNPTTIKDIRTYALGIFFIAATTTSIIGLLKYQPVFDAALTATSLSGYASQFRLGAFFEFLLMAANVGTAVMLFPFLSTTNRSWGIAYAAFRLMEVVFIGIGALAMLVLSSQLSAGVDTNQSGLTEVVRTIYKWTMISGPHFMLGINTAIYSTYMYRQRMIPKGIALLGMIGAALIFANAIAEIFQVRDAFSTATFITAFPIAIFEMILAVWIILKGLNVPLNKMVNERAESA